MKLTGVTAASILLATLGLIAATPQNSSQSANPAEAARLNNLGAAYMNQQLFEKGLKAFEQAAALDPKLQIAKLNQGIALVNLGRVDAAKPILEEAVKLNPKDAHAWYNLALLDKNSSSPQDAVEAFKHVIEIDPDDADTWYFLGSVYSQLKQFPQAIDAFNHALKVNPLHASAQFGLSRAYQQSGDPAQAREHLTRFQYVTQNKLGAAMSLAYGEQGQYSRVEESPNVIEKVPPQIPVKFVDVTEAAGLLTQTVSGGGKDPASYLGPGACFFDYDGDGKPDIFLPGNGPQRGLALYHNLGNGKFEDVTNKAGLDPTQHGIGCTAGDYDNDGATDLVSTFKGHIVLLHNEKNGTFKDVTAAAGIKTDAFDLGLTFVDYDHDGDIDLYITSSVEQVMSVHPGIWSEAAPRSGQSSMWRNNGNGTFTNVTDSVGLAGNRDNIAAIGSDYNNDRAVDIVTGGGKQPIIYENPREGKFPQREPWSTAMPSSTIAVAALDFDHDGWMDLAFTHAGTPALTLWRNNHGKSFNPITLPLTNWIHGYGLAAFDYDNDGWVDLVAVGETKDGKGEVKLFRNLGPDGFKDVTADVGLDKIELNSPRAIITGDYDNDGATDLLITQNHSPAVLLKNEGGNKNNWLRLALKGLNDNKSAIGTKVEVFSDGIRQKFEIYGSNGYLGQNSPYLTVGLGQSKEADVVRMLWPTGVLQDEVEVAANQQKDFLEIDRRGSSCPTLFVWNGKSYELVADVLGAGVVGHWVAPGERNIPRPTEYVKIDRNAIHEKNGKLSFRLMEPMEEVVYLDQVRLLAVDHPSNVDVYPNEYFASNPPYPPFKVIASRNARPPAGAWDDRGHDVLPDLLAHRYIGGFDLLSFKGFAKPHSLELDLGEPYQGGPLRLLLHGEIEYFTATGMYAADQAGIQATAPYVEALVVQKEGDGKDGKEKWVRVVDDMGFPAGLPRTMTADLTDKLPKGTKRVRISTNLQIYWDNILIDRTEQNVNSRLTPVPLQRADLGFHGYPRQLEAQPPGNVKYVYEQISRTGPYARQAGTYTRYGDVRPLLTGLDDKLAVFGSGEEVALEFDPSSLPIVPKGWARDYFFVANGYEKDMDFYAADGSTVEPLPFRKMGTYPYPGKSFPLDETHLDYFLKYNTRYVSGNEPQGYWYDYRPPK
ncbi:MAG TPA: FG-GAP-like repeat-containing protein [Terriglobales bacterium]|nr:FG-GAP-like repeat-containing protein [Terriglobales bacterium]